MRLRHCVKRYTTVSALADYSAETFKYIDFLGAKPLCLLSYFAVCRLTLWYFKEGDHL